MAYARFSRDSDVYVYEAEGGLVCMGCGLGSGIETRTLTRSEMIRHLEAHLGAGHNVPMDAIQRLRTEIGVEGDELAK
jgi:hypothetical protein